MRWEQLCGSLSILWHCLSLGLEWKLTFSSPVATAEFSKFAGIFSVALSQHHLSGFERAQLECHQFFLKSVPPIRKLTQTSYPPTAEGRQNKNHNHRKLTKLITWTTYLFSSMKLWATLCRMTQDGWVMVESSDKMWSTGEGNGKPLSILALKTPWTVWKG